MSQTRQWTDTLKRCLKTRGLTYRDVAKALNLSEASIKRLFSERSFSLRRLEQICQLMDMSFSDLARLNELRYEERLTVLSIEQESALADDAILLSYFYLLLNGWKKGRIAKRFDLEEPRQIRLLARLDRLGLIELQPGNRVRLLTARRIQWRRGGPVRRLYEREVKQAFLKDSFARGVAHFGFESAELAPESARLILRRLTRLTRDFDEMAEMDQNLQATEKRGYGLMVAIRPWAYWNIVLDGGQVQHDINLGLANSVRNLSIIIKISAWHAGVGITHMAMHNRRTRLGCRNGAVGDLGRAAWHMRAAILCPTRPGHGTGDKDVAVHGQGHLRHPFAVLLTLAIIDARASPKTSLGAQNRSLITPRLSKASDGRGEPCRSRP